MTEYLWETHLHTAEVSRCATVEGALLVRAYKEAGYHGLFVTDHFFNGNSWARGLMRWQKKVDILMKGYLSAKEAGEALGISVLWGWEYAHEGADFLTYGVGEAFLRDQPDLCDISLDAYIRRVQDAGGFVSQAHPFRKAWYMPEHVEKRWDIVDAFEVFNGSHDSEDREWDDQALLAAREHKLLETAGSDAHGLASAATAALSFEEPFTDCENFIAALRAGSARVVRRRT